jgi:ABC-type transport system involved in multi-copper enzyme maturation permease subunit
MKINIKITDKERHFLYRLLAVVLFVYLFATCVLSLAYLGSEYGLESKSYLLAGFILVVPMWLIVIAVFKHYR